MKNIFIITTPFQLLGSFEAINKLNLSNNILVVIDNNLENNAKQLGKLLEHNKSLFIDIVRFGYDKKSKFLSTVQLIKKYKKNKFKYIFIGDIGSIQKIFISNLDSRYTYLLDDGAKTILIHKSFKEKEDLFKKSFRQLRYMLFGLKISTKKEINIFTMFNLSEIDNIIIIKHTFEYFKYINKLKNKKIENKVYILGQPIVENKRVIAKSYEFYLNCIIQKYYDCEIYYLMHRREEKQQLLLYDLDKKMNILESIKPGELFFAELEYKPKVIIGINTTLLFSLASIFNDLSINSYKFKQKDILKNKDWFEESIIYFEHNKINIIKGCSK